MAVVVQEMIPADAAGVLFTIDPTTGDANRIVIEAMRGLGERVVGGRVAPERVILDRSSFTVVERHHGGHAMGDPMVLDNHTTQDLATLSQRVEGALPGPLDIEWAICRGSIYLLQARPATAQQRVETWAKRQIWTNGNSGEAVPDPITPMTYSMFMPFLQGLCDNLMGHLGFRIRAEQLISLIAGRPYFNVNLGAALLRRAPCIKPQDIGEIFGGAHETLARKGLVQLEAEDLPRLQFHPWQVIRGMPPVVVAMMRFLFLKNPQAVHALPRSPEVSRGTAFENYSDEAFLKAIRAALPTEQTGHDPALRFMGIGAFCLVAFFALSKRWFGAEGPALAGRLTVGLGTLNPAEAGRDLWRLAEFAQAHAQVRQAVEEERAFAALEQRLRTLTEGKAFLERWHAVLARHGHHARGELELMNPRWCETPDVVLALVRNYLEAVTRNLAVPATRLLSWASSVRCWSRSVCAG
jgi:pyruvate,water dikinase